jgi:hypothetical protein
MATQTRTTARTPTGTLAGTLAATAAPSPVAVVPSDEIERRVVENDTARSTRRAAAARRIGELASRHVAIAGQLADIERQLGELLAEAEEVVSLEELAGFTNVPVAALTQWRANHKPTRVKRRKPLHANARRPADSDHAATVAAPSTPASSSEAGAWGRDAVPVP